MLHASENTHWAAAIHFPRLQSLTSPSAWPTCAPCRGSSPSAWPALLSTRPCHPRLRTKTKRNSPLIMESNSSPYLHRCYLFSLYSHRECVDTDSREEISLAHHDVLTEKLQNMSGDWSLAQMHFHLEWCCKSNLNCTISIFCDSGAVIEDFTPSPLVFTSLIVRFLNNLCISLISLICSAIQIISCLLFW